MLLKQLNDLNWIYEIKEQNSFKEIENDKTYRFALPDFTYASGDGYSFLTSCKEIFSRMDIKIILEEYLMKIQQDNEWEKYSQTAPKSRILFKN